MTTKSAPLTRFRVVLPFLLYFSEKGGDPADILTESGCDPDLMSRPNDVITSHAVHSIVNAVCERLQDDFIGARIGESWAFENGPPFTKAKAESKFLGQLLNNVIADFSKESAAGNYTITIDQSFALFQGGRNFTPEYPTRQPDATFASFLVSIVKRWLGSSWDPKSVVLLVHDPKGLPHWIIPASSVLAGPENKISLRFPAAWLNVEKGKSLPIAKVGQPLEAIQADQLEAMNRFLQDHLKNTDIQISSAAKYCGLSVRGLQRMLKSQGTSFRNQLSETRIRTAIHLMETGNSPIAEIALAVGFASSTSFAKAFRKAHGVSPQEYRSSQQD